MSSLHSLCSNKKALMSYVKQLFVNSKHRKKYFWDRNDIKQAAFYSQKTGSRLAGEATSQQWNASKCDDPSNRKHPGTYQLIRHHWKGVREITSMVLSLVSRCFYSLG